MVLILKTEAIERLKEAVENLDDDKVREYIQKNGLEDESFHEAKDNIEHELLETIKNSESLEELENLFYDILDEEVEIEDD